jgi:hypothetical protein
VDTNPARELRSVLDEYFANPDQLIRLSVALAIASADPSSRKSVEREAVSRYRMAAECAGG